MADDFLSGRVEVNHAVLSVQYHHGVAHTLNDHIAGHRHDVKQPIAEQSPSYDQITESKSKGCHISMEGKGDIH